MIEGKLRTYSLATVITFRNLDWTTAVNTTRDTQHIAAPRNRQSRAQAQPLLESSGEFLHHIRATNIQHQFQCYSTIWGKIWNKTSNYNCFQPTWIISHHYRANTTCIWTSAGMTFNLEVQHNIMREHRLDHRRLATSQEGNTHTFTTSSIVQWTMFPCKTLDCIWWKCQAY